MEETLDQRLAAIAEDARVARENTSEILRLLEGITTGEYGVEAERERTLRPFPVTDKTGRGIGHRH